MAGRVQKKVLVVDDQPDIQDMVAMCLELEGYTIRTASNGREALDVVSRGLPDLILLDMKMPVMDGPSFVREFHARYNSQVPIVVLTAAADAREHAKEVGAAGWVGKPFDLDRLVAVVNKHLWS